MYITVIHYIDYTTLIAFILHYQTVLGYAYPPFLGAIKLYEHMGYTDFTAFLPIACPFLLGVFHFFTAQAP